MESEYSVSVSVLAKLRRGLDMEAANMDRDIEADYETLYDQELQKVILSLTHSDDVLTLQESLEERVLVEDPRYQQLERLMSGESEGAGDRDLLLTGDTQNFIDPWKR